MPAPYLSLHAHCDLHHYWSVIDSMNANVSQALCLPRLALFTLFSFSSFALAQRNAFALLLPPPTNPLSQSSPLHASSAGTWRVGEEGWGSSERCAGGQTSRYEAAQGNKEAEGEASCERVKERKLGEGEHNKNRRRGSRGSG